MRILITSILLFILSWSLQGQIFDPVKWDWKVENTDKVDEYNLVFTAAIETNWKIYSQYLESDDGPVRTSINYESADHVTMLGKNKESGKIQEGFDKLFEMNVISLSYPKAKFIQRIKVKEYGKAITGYIEFMSCDATQCLPPTGVDFSFEIEKPVEKEINDQKKTKVLASSKKENSTQGIKKTQITTSPSSKIENNNNTTTSEVGSISKVEKAILQNADGGQTLKKASSNLVSFKTDEPVQWSLISRKIDDETLELEFIVDLRKDWNIYSQFTEDDGPIPTTFLLEDSSSHKMMGKALEIGELKEGLDPLFNVIVKKFSKSPLKFIQKVKIGSMEPVSGYLTYMACDKKQCLPPTDVDFWVDPITLETYLGTIAAAKNGIADGSDGGGISVINSSDGIGGPIINGNIIDQKVAVLSETHESPLTLCGEEEEAMNTNLIWTFIFGFLGGLLALLTPCVFPMIPLTVSYFTKGSKDKKSGIKNGVIYGLSIIVIYVLIGLLVTGLFGATALNELSTNWIANVLFFIVFIVFAISFFGYFEITLPSSWTNASDKMADGGGLLGIFFMAFTLALVSFSCTGPIIGSALVQSATEALGPFTVMLGFSMALALPFGLFAAFPALLNSLPQSGGWMTSVKVVLGFLEVALAFKFLSIADMTMHWGILKYELFMGIWILVFAAMALYAFGYIKFPHDSPIKKLSKGRWTLGIVSILLTVYLISGFRISEKTGVYDSLALMSGLAPPANYNYFLNQQEADADIKSKYASYSVCANNINCFKDYYEGMAYAKEVNKPVFLDFTGYGCVNCRKTEEHIWVDDKVQKHLNDDFVLISLYVDDRTKLDKIMLSKHTEKKMRSIGNKWADFQIVNFKQNSQPLYVMVTPDEKVITHPRGYKEGIEGYLEYLDCGLAYYFEENE